MFDNMSQQVRVIIAVILALLFFSVYGYLVPQPVQQEQNSTLNEQSTKVTKDALLPNKESKKTSKIIASVKNEHFSASINENGEISSFLLEDNRFKNENNEAINLVNDELLPLSMQFYDEDFQKLYNSQAFSVQKQEFNTNEDIVLSKNLNGVVLEKIINFKDNGFYEVKLKISDDKEHKFVITPGLRPNILADSLTVHGAMIYKSDETKDDYEDDSIKKADEVVISNAQIAAFSDRYYTTLFYNFNQDFKVVLTNSTSNLTQGRIIATNNAHFYAYIGPKEHKILDGADKRLSNVVEYGWFTFIAKPMFAFLNSIYNFVGNWGWAIVILTIIIRIILFPLTYKSMVSMQKLKILAPKMKEIQEKYKGEPQKMQMHIMNLYKEHKANPLGGCLPILIQIPIFFAIYRVLLNAIELKAAPWALWINDLALHDPFYILPIYMGLTMFLQQVITPMNIQDPTQAKIMKFLPLIFVIFFISFPAGLTLYWCVNNTFSLAQQYFINKIFAQKEKSNASK